MRTLLLRMLVVFTAALVVLVGGIVAQRTDTTEVAAPAPSAPPAPPPPPPPPPAGPPVLAVKIDNVPDARPPIGVAAADMVYVEPVEGGASRLIGLFASKVPEVVGPVRSARETDLELLPQFGRPSLAFSGAAPELLPKIDQAAVQNVAPERFPDAYFRGKMHEIPHNLYLRPDRVPRGEPWSPQAPVHFGPTPPGGTPATHEEVEYESARIGFDWAPDEQRWLVSMDGDPYSATDTGRLGASTVVLQDVRVHDSALSDVAGNVSPFAETLGSGRAVILRDGLAFEAVWSRPSPGVGTTYTTPDGKPLTFAPGQVWTAFRPAG